MYKLWQSWYMYGSPAIGQVNEPASTDRQKTASVSASALG
jgi:hypothetical protein